MATAARSRYTPKARNDAYTGLLFISFLALVASCIFLYLDYDQYGKSSPQFTPAVKSPPGTLPAASAPPASAPSAPMGEPMGPGNVAPMNPMPPTPMNPMGPMPGAAGPGAPAPGAAGGPAKNN